jgi:glycosyltransferase involved in cell wall biosynthesis
VKIDLYSKIKDEIQLLPYFLRHYEAIADRIFVWDDGSTDGTLEMLKAHPKVTLLDLPVHGLEDTYASYHLFPIYKELSRGKADWVMQVDIDEFIYHPDILARLEEFKRDLFDIVTLVGYMMVAESFPQTDKQLWDVVTHGLRDRTMDKPVIFNPEIDIVFMGGRHRIASAAGPGGRPIVMRWKSKVKLLHYRYFGYEYFRERTRRNCEEHFKSGSAWGREVAWPFDENHPWRMPDGRTGTFPKYFADNLDKVEQVV